MTHAKKHLSKRSDTRSAELRKSVRFVIAASCDTEYRIRSNVGVGDEDSMEVLGENEDSVSEDFPTVSAIPSFSI